MTDKDIINYYTQNIVSIAATSKYFKIDPHKISKILKSNNIELRSESEVRLANVKHDLFSEINSESVAYIVGFLLADGYIKTPKENDKCNRQSSVCLEAKDIYPLKLLKTLSNTSAKIITRKKSINNHICIMYSLKVTSDRLVNDIAKYGIIKRKTGHEEIKNIPEQYLNHFLRGFIDGDGTWGFYPAKNKTTHTRTLSIVSGGEHILSQISKILYKITGNKRELYTSRGCYYLSYHSKNDLTKIIEYLYSNATIYLQRKKVIVDNIMNELHANTEEN